MSRTDFEGWARGLQNCNYATEKTYAQNLVNYIKKYNLDSYDIPAMLEPEDDNSAKVNAPKTSTGLLQAPQNEPIKNLVSKIARIINNTRNLNVEEEGLFEIVSVGTTKSLVKRLRNAKPSNLEMSQEEGLFEIRTTIKEKR